MPRTRLATAVAELQNIEERSTTDAEGAERNALVRKIEHDVERVSGERSALARAIGRVGVLSVAKEHKEKVAQEPYVKVPREDLTALAREVEMQVKKDAGTPDALIAALLAVGKTIKAFVQRFAVPKSDMLADEERSAYALENERTELLAKDARLAEELERAKSALARARSADPMMKPVGNYAAVRSIAHNQRRMKKAWWREPKHMHMSSHSLPKRLSAIRERCSLSRARWPSRMRRLQHCRQKSVESKEDRRRSLERMKIRLEEAGGTGEDIRQEHKEVYNRETFLAKELDDLAKSSAGLGALIHDLDTELAKHFSEGLARVIASFSEYFALMFDGGSARLTLEEPEVDEEEAEDGEERSDVPQESERAGIGNHGQSAEEESALLMQLSGGERALTSIALIFAMSQVNPPPFLILDETDAALDEANSRRYGDMIENLAKKSQLIVITHNRETTSRTNILYGVTMGGDGVSKLLSVKFDEKPLRLQNKGRMSIDETPEAQQSRTLRAYYTYADTKSGSFFGEVVCYTL